MLIYMDYILLYIKTQGAIKMSIKQYYVVFAVFMISTQFFGAAYAHNGWIPSSIPYATTYSPPIIEVPSVPTLVYSTYQQPLPISYAWVPYYVNKPLIIERHGLLCKYRVVTYQTVIEWIYQPIYR